MHPEHLTLPKYRADIDGLRAIAVLSVVGFHAFPSLVQGGFVGVDIFFVISGFLISTIVFGSLQRGSFSFAEFYSRRIKRIFPALLLVLIASLAYGWFALLPNEYKQLGKHIAGGAGFVSNFVLQNEGGYFDNAAQTKPLLHLWSLGIEEQFYIVWPLLLWLAWRDRATLPTVVIAVGVVSFALYIGLLHVDPDAAFYAPHARFWELVCGSLLAYATLFRQEAIARFRKGAEFQSRTGAVLIVVGIFGASREMQSPGWLAILPTAGAALMIAAGPQARLNRAVLSNRVMVWFGLISYPLYLWHWPLLTFARFLENETPAFEIRTAVVFVAVVLAWLTYRLIEVPVRFGGHGNAKAISLVILMAAAGYAGYETYKRDGLGFRFPKIIQGLLEYKYDYRKGYSVGSCSLHLYLNNSAFDSCESTPGKGFDASILIWGDSHAAHLYSGYNDAFGDRFMIIKRTSGGCPPILDSEISSQPNCRNINAHVLEMIREVKPNRVVLAAAWSKYDWKNIEFTVAQLRKFGITNIDLVGPVPKWIDGLQRQLYLYFEKYQSVPGRMTFGLNRDFMQLDAAMNEFAKRLAINYLSPAQILCDEAGCITKLGESADTLTTWDDAHLTDAGSRFLVARFPGASN